MHLALQRAGIEAQGAEVEEVVIVAVVVAVPRKSQTSFLERIRKQRR